MAPLRAGNTVAGMLFPTAAFAGFFTVAYLAHATLRTRRGAWMWTMLLLSCVFYGWFDPRLGLALPLYAVLTHGAARTIERFKPPAVLAAAVGAHLLVLAALRYAEMLLSPLPGLDLLGSRVAGWITPIGLGFLVLQSIGYLVEVRHGRVQARSFIETATFLTFFPQLVCGPVLRSKPFFDQLDAWPRPTGSISEAGTLLLAAIVKKVVLAEALYGYSATVLGSPVGYSGLEVGAAAVGFTLFLLCDVSSYTDFARAIAALFGIQIPRNFDQPLAATSFSDFWRRWHSTVYAFMRDHLFRPLSGPGGVQRTVFAVTVTFALSGLWHGAQWRYAVYGLVFGALIGVETAVRIVRTGRRRHPTLLTRISGRVYVLTVFSLMNVFGMWGLDGARDVVTQLFGGAGTGFAVPGAVLLAGACAYGFQFVSKQRFAHLPRQLDRIPPMIQGASFAAAVTIIAALGAPGVPAFFYYRM